MTPKQSDSKTVFRAPCQAANQNDTHPPSAELRTPAAATEGTQLLWHRIRTPQLRRAAAFGQQAKENRKYLNLGKK